MPGKALTVSRSYAGKSSPPIHFSGWLFIFRSRRGTAIKLLAYDGQGFWLATKRLSKGRFRWWPTGEEPAQLLRAHQAQLLLAAGNPDAEAAPEWRRVSA
jgi:transposase